MKSKYFYLTIVSVIFLFVSITHSQVILRYSDGDEAKDVDVDYAGNVYVTGSTYVSPYGNAITTIKYSPSAATNSPPVWVRQYLPAIGSGCLGGKSEVDNSGNIYVTGYTFINNSGYIITRKYDPNGNTIWDKQILQNRIPIPTAIVADNLNGYVYVTGFVKINNTNDQKLFTVRYKMSDGSNYVHIFDYGFGATHPTDAAVALNGNVYVTGWIYNSSGIKNFGTIKYQSPVQSPNSLTPAWNPVMVTYDGGNDDYASSIAIDNSTNDFYVTGSTTESFASNYSYLTIRYNSNGAELGFARYNYSNQYLSEDSQPCKVLYDQVSHCIFVTGFCWSGSSRDDIVTIKYNSISGPVNVPSAVSKFGNSYYPYLPNLLAPAGDFPIDMTFSSDGYLYVTGATEDPWNTQNNTSDYLTLKYNKNLNLICKSIYNGTANQYDGAAAIDSGDGGRVYVTGLSYGAGTFGDMTTIKYSGKCKKVKTKFKKYFILTENPLSDSGNVDTATVELRNHSAPYDLITSFTGQMTVDGLAEAELCAEELETSQNFYIVVKSRNTIETWSANPQHTTDDTLFYDFTSSASQAFGNNMQQMGNEWVLYPGDVNQDGTIDLTDVTIIDNDAYNFMMGHVVSDLNGDDFVDVSDILIAENNSFNFVSAMRP